tara:strand:- start:226 stop:402 length:177 start_codon:yes stop_codon:yes gene_type:complete
MELSLLYLFRNSSEKPLRKLGDIDFWVEIQQYKIIQITHHVWLQNLVSFIIEPKKMTE